jgi:hypothetical protein
MLIRYLKKPYTEDDEERLTRNLQSQPLRLADVPVCDFCGGPSPVTIYGSIRMSTGESRRCWRWCACAECEKLVDTNDWDKLRVKVVDRLKTMLPRSIPREALTNAVMAVLGIFVRDAEIASGEDSTAAGK